MPRNVFDNQPESHIREDVQEILNKIQRARLNGRSIMLTDIVEDLESILKGERV